MSVRRALFWSTSERYTGLLFNFVLIVVLSRLLTPGEIGVLQLGSIVLLLSEPLRDLGTGAYLVQKNDLEAEDTRTAFTFALLVSTVLALGAFAGATTVARFYQEPGLQPFLKVLAPTFLLAPFASIPMSLLRREMAFGSLAFINVSCALLNVLSITALVVLGFGAMSPAWAAWVWSVAFVALTLWVRPDPAPFRITLCRWRSLLPFAAYGTAPQVLQRLHDFLPALVLGRLLSIEALGFFDRAAKVAELPEKIGTVGVQAVALPGFASAARAGGALKQSYLDAVAHVSAVHWTGLLLLVLLADPIVRLLLGPQWTAVVGLVRIIAIALLATSAQALNGAVLVAAGHVRDTTLIAMLVLPITAVLFLVAAPYGLVPAAWSLVAIGLVHAVVSHAFVARRLAIAWREIAAPLLRSLAAGTLAMAGPLAILAFDGFDLRFGIGSAAAIGVLAPPGWLLGLWITKHPLGTEIAAALRAAAASTGRRRPDR